MRGHCRSTSLEQTAFSDNATNTVLRDEKRRKPLHPCAGRGPDADLLVTAVLPFFHVRSSMNDEVTRQIDGRPHAPIENANLRGVANTEQGARYEYSITSANRSHDRFRCG